MAGAAAIQVGAACLASPEVCLIIVEGIERFMRDKGVDNITDLIGAAQHSEC
jgi:dihydroorotate dehydrogenase (NAD+) catalytic subunit